MKRILVLGDGDFSFSATLITALFKLPDFKSFSFVVTSFDDHDEVCSKYSETNSILMGFSKFDNVVVKHGVDATVSLAELLTAGKVLHTDGVVYLSLAFAQAERWGLETAVAAANFTSFDTAAFDLHNSWGSTYNIKRHHNGQSFVRRIGKCACFCFRRSDSASPPARAEELLVPNSANPSLFRLGLLLAGPAPSVLGEGTREEIFCVEEGGGHSAKRARKEARKGKRGAESGGDECFDRRVGESGPGRVPTVAFVCRECGKEFPLEQGVRSHVRLVHELGLGAAAAQPLPCPHCDRVFHQQASLTDHLLAKHTGTFVDVKPDWAASSSSTATADATVDLTIHCGICRMLFGSDQELERHLVGGINPGLSVQGGDSIEKVSPIICSNCGKTFKDQRGLKQHFNLCNTFPSAR